MLLNWNFIKGVGETKISSVRGMNISTMDKHNVNSNLQCLASGTIVGEG